MTKDFDLSALGSAKYILKEKLVSYIKDNTNYYKDSSVRWVIHELVKEGELTKLDSEYYYHGVLKEYHQKEGSKKIMQVKQMIQDKYPELNAVIYELIILNEWLNHQISRNVIFVQVEKYYMEFVFKYLKDHFKQDVLYSPTIDDFNLYAENDVIVISNLITRAPTSKSQFDITIEKLIVDLFSNDLISNLFSSSEYETILEGIFSQYKVNTKKVLSYAKRRNLAEIVGKYITKYDRKRELDND